MVTEHIEIHLESCVYNFYVLHLDNCQIFSLVDLYFNINIWIFISVLSSPFTKKACVICFTIKKSIINIINGLYFYSSETTGGGITETGGITEVIWNGSTPLEALSKYYGGSRYSTTSKACILAEENPVRDPYTSGS